MAIRVARCGFHRPPRFPPLLSTISLNIRQAVDRLLLNGVCISFRAVEGCSAKNCRISFCIYITILTMVVRMVRIEPNRGNGRGSLARLGSASSFRSLSCRQLPSWFLISFRFHNCCLWLALISATSSTTRAWSRALAPATTTLALATAATVCPKTPSSCWRTTRTCPRI